MSEWIKTGDRLPDDFLEVLTVRSGDMNVGFLEGDKWRYVNGYEMFPQPSHWMELPEAPE